MDRKGQMTILIIVALVIVGGIVTVYVYRDRLFVQSVPAEFRPVFDYYKSCIEFEARSAIDLAESQGGRVYPGAYIPGSEYAPFSSQLNFLGFPVPYWFYLSGNGIVRENVPKKSEIQNEISQYVTERVNDGCNFDDFYAKGFLINLSAPKVKATIEDNKIIIDLGAEVVVSKEDGGSARLTSHKVEVGSAFGRLYDTAIEIYTKEKADAFLENYSVDILRTYAPVDGVELGCAGMVWKTREVTDELKGALEANIAAIKFEGDYYTSEKYNNYFVVDLPVKQQVNLLYSRAWPTKIEIAGADNELMVAEPVGTQEGMGVMGFCYSPYHFIYDISYPVLVQVIEGSEILQFPVVVIVDKNRPREGIYSEIPIEEETLDVCKYYTQDVVVNVYDNQLNKVDANISYMCFNQICDLGETENGEFIGMAPACVNGYLRARAAGYAEKRQLFSTNEESASDLILDREYETEIVLESGGSQLGKNAVITFAGQKTASALLPEVPKIILSEGFYNVSVYVYDSSALKISGFTKRECSEVPKGLFGGLFGFTEERCFDIVVPETTIDSALIGGGRGEIYLLPSDLESGRLRLEVGTLPTPRSIEELQANYQVFETLNVRVV